MSWTIWRDEGGDWMAQDSADRGSVYRSNSHELMAWLIDQVSRPGKLTVFLGQRARSYWVEQHHPLGWAWHSYKAAPGEFLRVEDRR